MAGLVIYRNAIFALKIRFEKANVMVVDRSGIYAICLFTLVGNN